MKQYLRELPPVHEIQNNERYVRISSASHLANEPLKEIIQEAVDYVREQLLNGHIPSNQCSKNDFMLMILDFTEEKINTFVKARLTKVINGTGTVLHTNLGRARLSDNAIKHVSDVASSYSNLEYRIKEGKRGSRHDIIEDLLIKVTGAEAAMVVNNNAAAVFLILRALANEGEVIVSRGQLVEIGGSFRISSIMEESGAMLVEVGTTNKTHFYDYENAINDSTSMILKVHTSNFKTVGFTESVDTKELMALKSLYPNLTFYEDLGSGSLYDFKKLGIGDEPVVREVLESGVDLVSFSGDKLLGGPQAGIIAGKKELIQKLKKHQLARVLRVDKMTFAALEQTLKVYLSEQDRIHELPTVRDIIKSIDEIHGQAEFFKKYINKSSALYEVDIQENTSQVGGGTMPDVELATVVAAVSHRIFTANELAEKLRIGNPAIITRVKDDKVLIDFRTVTGKEMDDLMGGFLELV
ncbi:L-seryl-tRNA(Sec) selenium transferase [Virgibacillus necropolis]|uniref:L-seryl-tRNA(Sec) selenium transferase n=1 Tax=Virgibacillus necropolis TaxID=163877 RepID=A0A221MAV9_9BACI|nr:L-seryl-tRNA(Sec) selenium transferase [Virgibacillus necropolis]ASN04795.1 L-seryl-tRNA(Sec) selenium transferase [Virgibacillus necropolis]